MERFTLLRKPTFCLSSPKILDILCSLSEIISIKTLCSGQYCPLKVFLLAGSEGGLDCDLDLSVWCIQKTISSRAYRPIRINRWEHFRRDFAIQRDGHLRLHSDVQMFVCFPQKLEKCWSWKYKAVEDTALSFWLHWRMFRCGIEAPPSTTPWDYRHHEEWPVWCTEDSWFCSDIGQSWIQILQGKVFKSPKVCY